MILKRVCLGTKLLATKQLNTGEHSVDSWKIPVKNECLYLECTMGLIGYCEPGNNRMKYQAYFVSLPGKMTRRPFTTSLQPPPYLFPKWASQADVLCLFSRNAILCTLAKIFKSVEYQTYP